MTRPLLIATLVLLSVCSLSVAARERGGDLELTDIQRSQLEEIERNCAGRDNCRQQFESILNEDQRAKLSQQRGHRPGSADGQSRPEGAGRGRPR